MSAAVAVAIALAALLLSLAPLWRETDEAATLEPVSRRDRLQARKTSLYTSIKDLDFDFQTGKLSTDDYDTVRQGLLNEAALVVKDLEDAGKGDAVDAMLERELGARRRSVAGAVASGPVCAACGTQARLAARFCKKCGHDLAATACASCGKPLDDDATFCAACGAKVATGKAL